MQAWCWLRCTETACTRWCPTPAWQAAPTPVSGWLGRWGQVWLHRRGTEPGHTRVCANLLPSVFSSVLQLCGPSTHASTRCCCFLSQRAAVVPPAYACLNPDMSLSLGQTMALIFPPDDPKGTDCLEARLAASCVHASMVLRLCWRFPEHVTWQFHFLTATCSACPQRSGPRAGAASRRRSVPT